MFLGMYYADATTTNDANTAKSDPTKSNATESNATEPNANTTNSIATAATATLYSTTGKCWKSIFKISINFFLNEETKQKLEHT